MLEKEEAAGPHRGGARRAAGGKPPVWLRIVLPVALIVVWLAGAGIGGPYFGKVGEVASNDQAAFLPASADATLVGERFTDFVGDEQVPAIVVFASEDQLTETQLAELTAVMEELGNLAGVESLSPLIPSEDGLAAQAFIPLDAEAELGDLVAEVRTVISDGAPEGVAAHVTGPAGFSADLGEAFGGIDGLLLAVALGAVLVILLIVYRSLLLPFLVLATSVFALCVALLVNWWLAKWGILTLNGQTQGILFILVIGAATDYALLYTARFQEELRRNESRMAATRKTIRGSLEPILASGGTVIAGLLCLLFSDLSSNKSLGPVAAIGIGFAMLSALTLLPSMLLLLGRAAYWPRRPRFDPQRDAEASVHRGIYAAIGRKVSRRPRLVWIACVVLLAVGAAFVPTLKADGVATSELVIGASDARDGQQALAEHFPGGSGDPANVLVAEADLQEVADVLLAADGVDSVAVLAADSPSGSAPVTEEGIQPLGPPGTPAPEPTVREGDVLLQATLAHPADSAEAETVVRDLRVELDGTALIGGTTAVAIDTNDTS
ncbi:MMPL family transporter, partial [Tessaracoccus terricola]